MEIKIFVKNDCPNCVKEKESFSKLDTKALNITWYNTDTALGLAEASFYNVSDLPTFVILKDNKQVYNNTKCMTQEDLN